MQVFPILQDKAILPHEREFAIKGKSQKKGIVEVYLDNSLLSKQECEENWTVIIPSQTAGGPHTLQVKDQDSQVEFSDIYFGEVFLLIGQSNMQLTMERCMDAFPEYMPNYKDSLIRELRLPLGAAFHEEESAWTKEFSWKELAAENVEAMGALGLSFAMHRRKEKDIPIGLIQCAAGGTTIESWIDLKRLGPIEAESFSLVEDAGTREEISSIENKKILSWYKKANAQKKNLEKAFSIPKPQMFFDTAIQEDNYCGFIKIESHFTITEEDYQSMPEENIIASFGVLDNHDITFINGQRIGSTGYQYPPRKYPIKKSLLHAGENTITIELYIARNPGGFIEGKFYGLLWPSEEGKKALPFDQAWDVYWAKDQGLEPSPPPSFWDRWPSTNYYAYLKELKNFPFHGVLWYQGESNDKVAAAYKNYLSILVQQIQEEYPGSPLFLIQLPQFDDPARLVQERSWAKIRQAQYEIARDFDEVYLIVTLDLGERNDLHPIDKWNIGIRVNMAYEAASPSAKGKENLSPTIEKIKQEDRKLAILFTQKVSYPEKVEDAFVLSSCKKTIPFTIVEAKEKSLLLEAEEDFDTVEYLFDNAPVEVYIKNENGLLLSPFRYIF